MKVALVPTWLQEFEKEAGYMTKQEGKEQPELQFPITFSKCPNCGSTRRIANEVLEGEKKKKGLNPKLMATLLQHQVIIADPTRTWLSAPAISSSFDACADCGTVYCVVAILGTAMPGDPRQSRQSRQ